MESIFSPENCADLHNQLLHRHISNIPDAAPSRTLVSRFHQASPQLASIPSLNSLLAYRFLSLLDTYSPTADTQAPQLLTPQACQPDPQTFFHDVEFAVDDSNSGNPTIILLYAGAPHTSQEYGGLYLDLQTCRAHWRLAPHQFAPRNQWVPLDLVLRKWLALWDIDKYHWDPAQSQPSVQPWVEADVSASLSAWESLLGAINSRLPQQQQEQASNQSSPRLPPLSLALLDQYALSPFTKAFLSRAQRPSNFHLIGPGISAFTPDSFTFLYSSEAADSARRRWTANSEPDEWPALLLPAASSVPHPAPDRSFDQPWGFSHFTVLRRAGLYLGTEMAEADAVCFVTQAGASPVFCFAPPQCPWGPGRAPRLAEVLERWAGLVTAGVWRVDGGGVCEGLEWFQQHRTARDVQLEWNDNVR